VQASEIVKANSLADKIVVIHGRVEVRFYVYTYCLLLIIVSFCVAVIIFLV
jgi:hypothetical protein